MFFSKEAVPAHAPRVPRALLWLLQESTLELILDGGKVGLAGETVWQRGLLLLLHTLSVSLLGGVWRWAR